MVFAINLSILDDLVKADRPMLNRCSKENPYSFRKKRYCCSRPVDFQWKKDGYCYGKTQRCSHEEGCENCEYFFGTLISLINVEGGIFWKKLVHNSNKRGVDGGKI